MKLAKLAALCMLAFGIAASHGDVLEDLPATTRRFLREFPAVKGQVERQHRISLANNHYGLAVYLQKRISDHRVNGWYQFTEARASGLYRNPNRDFAVAVWRQGTGHAPGFNCGRDPYGDASSQSTVEIPDSCANSPNGYLMADQSLPADTPGFQAAVDLLILWHPSYYHTELRESRWTRPLITMKGYLGTFLGSCVQSSLRYDLRLPTMDELLRYVMRGYQAELDRGHMLPVKTAFLMPSSTDWGGLTAETGGYVIYYLPDFADERKEILPIRELEALEWRLVILLDLHYF